MLVTPWGNKLILSIGIRSSSNEFGRNARRKDYKGDNFKFSFCMGNKMLFSTFYTLFQKHYRKKKTNSKKVRHVDKIRECKLTYRDIGKYKKVVAKFVQPMDLEMGCSFYNTIFENKLSPR